MTGFTRRGVLGVAACLATMAVVAAPASAKTTTLHFFEKTVSFSITDANGTPVSMNAPPAAGDRLVIVNNEFTGNHKHHSKKPTATVHISCVVGSGATALCNAELAMGSSMLLADFWSLNLSSNGANNVPITGGTGKFLHAHGRVVTTPVGNPNNNQDDTTVTFSG